MNAKLRSLIVIFAAVFTLFTLSLTASANAQNNNDAVCSVYLTGIGCPNCAVTDPVLLRDLTAEYPDLVVIEYEIYESHESNQSISGEYFNTYIPVGRAGVPFIIFDKDNTALGRFEVLDAEEKIASLDSNPCPLSDGTIESLKDLDLTKLEGKINIWTKNRFLQSGEGGDNDILHKLIFTEDVEETLKDVDHEIIEPVSVPLSGAEVNFDKAAKIGSWTFQWNTDDENVTATITNGVDEVSGTLKWAHSYWLPITIGILLLFIFFYFVWVAKKRACFCISLSERQKDIIIIGLSAIFLIGFFILSKNISPEALEEIGYSMPLPFFTFFIALIDGFNPCNLFVLTFLLGLLVSASHSRLRILIIGYTFIFVVFVIYFLFMAAWLNIFKYIGFITPLRIAIAAIAIIAGLINCKELLFFRKGVTLMIQEQHKGPLVKKIEAMKEVIQKASLPALITSSIGLAAFASLVELPCTAGFPIIYTGVLSGKLLDNTLGYYLYLLLYNFVYVIPLIVIITVLGYTFKAEKISKRQMQIIKFIGGLIMILLGIILLFNPGLIGLGIGG